MQTSNVNLCGKQIKICSTFQSVFNKNTFLIKHLNVSVCVLIVVFLIKMPGYKGVKNVFKKAENI